MRNENIAANPAVETGPLTRRRFMGVAAMLAPGLCAMGPEGTALPAATTKQANLDEHNLTEEIKKEKIRRAMLAGPSSVTAEATIAEMGHHGNLTVLRPGTNEWVCIPGDQNVVGRPDMALDPMGMVWFKDVLARKPKPTNTSPGLIYMLNGATQRSYTDPFDTTSPPIPIGPHWMILWPFDANRIAPFANRMSAARMPPCRKQISQGRNSQ